MSSTRLSRSKSHKLATQFRFSLIGALALISVCPLLAVAQDGHSHTAQPQQETDRQNRRAKQARLSGSSGTRPSVQEVAEAEEKDIP